MTLFVLSLIYTVYLAIGSLNRGIIACISSLLCKTQMRSFKHFVLDYLILKSTRCRPSKGRRCIPEVVFKNEGSMVQTCRKINVHLVITNISRKLHEVIIASLHQSMRIVYLN